MSDDLSTRKEKLENELKFLLDEIKQKTTPSKYVQICENLVSVAKTDLDKVNPSINKCQSCGEPLEEWEKKICGPCKISDSRYEEEEE